MLLLLSASALAADPIPEVWGGASDEAPVQPTLPSPGGLTFLGLFQARAAASNVITTAAFDGQVVGLLGGTNGTTVFAPGQTDTDGDGVADEGLGNSTWTEQRLNGFFTWAPPTLDGRASLTAGFEVDFLYGDASYGIGGNAGGGFGGDSVNLQTRRLHVTFKPTDALKVIAGLQFVADGAYDPTAATMDDLIRTGGGLRFFGSEAAGVTLFGRHERVRYRLGTYNLIEGGVSRIDDVALHMADLEVNPSWNTRLGAHAWALRDGAGGDAGLLGSGPTSDLSALQGGPALDYARDESEEVEVDADLVWLGLDGGLNHRLDAGKLGASGLAMLSLGRLYITDQLDVPVRGWLVGGEVRYRIAPGEGSILRGELLVDSRDGTDRSEYTGVVTGNSYGFVGAVWSTHGTLLLFPDPQAINRQIAVVSDVSNGGSGMLALSASAGYDLIPDILNLTAHAAQASSPSAALSATELGARVGWRPWLLWRLSAGGAVVTGTDQPADPWIVQTYLEWIAL
jgi:hypothetical protein